jgi:hypothetical protein
MHHKGLLIVMVKASACRISRGRQPQRRQANPLGIQQRLFEDYDMPGERSPAGAITAGGAKAAWFKDSEGNILALIQSL